MENNQIACKDLSRIRSAFRRFTLDDLLLLFQSWGVDPVLLKDPLSKAKLIESLLMSKFVSTKLILRLLRGIASSFNLVS